MATQLKDYYSDIQDAKRQIREVAVDMYKKAGGNVDSTVDLVQRKIDNSPKLHREIAEPLISWAVRMVVEEINRKTRQFAWDEKGEESNLDPQTRSGILQAASRSLMDYRLSGGKKLGDATKIEVARAASFQIEFGKSNVMRGMWLDLIQKRMKKDNDIVRKVLAEEELQKLQEQARRGVE